MLINSPNISGSLTVTGNSVISGSLNVLGSITGAITGSATTASYVEYTNVANKPALVSGSSQVTYSGLTGIPSGIVSGSSQVSFNGIVDKPTLVSGSSQITYSGLTGIPSGIVSGSGQVSFNGITDKPTLVSGSSQISYPDLSNMPSGIVSGSSQVSFNGITDKPTLVSGSSQITYSGLTGIPSGIVSGSSQVTYSGLTGIPSGIVSGSSQVSYTDLSNIPSGIVSGSAQIASLGYATTSSNTFQGSQTVTGSLFITQNLTVGGSSSIQYISSSVVDIADNIITVNAFNPGIRFGGLAVADSGSSPRVSGSILFDSIKDQWIFVHENQTIITSSVVLMGPETYNDLGNETYISTNRLPKGSGVEHLRNSNITDTGTVVSINSNTEITGSLTVTSTGTVNGATITTNTAAQTLTNKTIAAGSNTITGLTNANLSGTAGITNANLANSTITIAGNSTALGGSITAATILSGTGVFSGSAQIPNASITNAQLANSTISSIALGSNLATLTIGTGLTGTSYNGSTAVTIANAGVTSITAGSGISVNASTGGVTITNTITNNNQLTNGAGYITGITSGNVTTALGYTPLNRAGDTMSGILYSTYNTATNRPNLGFSVARTILGNLHIQNGSGPVVDSSNQAAITFQGGTSSEAQAGIYVLNNVSYGTSMGFATTDSYATGPQLFMTATNNGVVNFPRARPTALGNTIWDAGNLTNLNQLANGPGYITAATFDGLAFKTQGTGTYQTSGDFRAPIFYDSQNISFYFDGSAVADSIRVAGDIVAYFSDERLKDIKQNIPNALAKVMTLDGFYYEPNEIAQSYGYEKKLRVGLSAQQVEAVLPEVIKNAPIGDGYKTVDYSKLVPLLVEAIKEQQQQIEELKSKLD